MPDDAAAELQDLETVAENRSFAVRTDGGTVRVVGTVAGLGFENAVFSTGTRAARLSLRSPGSWSTPMRRPCTRRCAAARASGSSPGNALRYADADAGPDPDRDSEALTAMSTMFGTAGGVTGFVSVSVAASTFAFAMARRRREFGLLPPGATRLCGRRPYQNQDTRPLTGSRARYDRDTYEEAALATWAEITSIAGEVTARPTGSPPSCAPRTPTTTAPPSSKTPVPPSAP